MILAKHNGGTLLEKFLVTVGFLKGLVLNALRRKNIIPENKFPFIIHVSSHSNKPEAISTSNSLRKNGYDAYTAPVRVSIDIQIYRVYTGRFSNWDEKVLGSTNSSRKASCRARYSYSLSFYLASGGSGLNRAG